MAEANHTENEIWKQVPGWEGYYSVSSMGRIRRDASGPNTWVGKILKSFIDNSGYLQSTLCKQGRKHNCRIHVMVAITFLGPKPKGHEINHKNTNKQDNRPENLEYLTRAAHDEHTTFSGLRPTGERHGSRTHPERVARGEQISSAKLVGRDILEIRKLLAGSVSQRIIAEKFGVDQTTVSCIKLNKSWAHI